MLTEVVKPKYIKELGDFDSRDMQRVYQHCSENVWKKENAVKENSFECFHHTQHIIFRFIKEMRDPRVFYSNPIWEIFKSELLPAFDSITKNYCFKNPIYPKVMLARLDAHQSIDAHTDGAGANLYTHKIHVPLKTHNDVSMQIGSKSFHLETGKAYEVNNLARHSVTNNSDEDRVHLIFEVFDGDDHHKHTS
ncbi:Uncharacterised protein [BD1-7 clade bacterium]|uniref:Aspartyl/asparaginy/proline hydroxylase domain-containing protein n=1 Tax=BD1-7 clade bacterium TaxID=2029982 RepID=A0A5S9QVF6_9GAMM|nr:Uncharacterised protein [BD1-7 clade bacterium]